MSNFNRYSNYANLVSTALDSNVLPMCSSNPNADLYSKALDIATRLNAKGYGDVFAYDEQVNFNNPRNFVRMINDLHKEQCNLQSAYNNLSVENKGLRDQIASRDAELDRTRAQMGDLATQVAGLREAGDCPTCPPQVPCDCPTSPTQVPCDCPTNQDINTPASSKSKLPWTWIILGTSVAGFAGYKYYTK